MIFKTIAEGLEPNKNQQIDNISKNEKLTIHSNGESFDEIAQADTAMNKSVEPTQAITRKMSCLKLTRFFETRKTYSLFLFSDHNKYLSHFLNFYISNDDCEFILKRLRAVMKRLIDHKWFDNIILGFIALNSITLAIERPSITDNSWVSCLGIFVILN